MLDHKPRPPSKSQNKSRKLLISKSKKAIAEELRLMGLIQCQTLTAKQFEMLMGRLNYLRMPPLKNKQHQEKQEKMIQQTLPFFGV